MITQYDAVAEIEAMKLKRARPAGTSEEPTVPRAWPASGEAAIKAEMERRFRRRAASRHAAVTPAAAPR